MLVALQRQRCWLVLFMSRIIDVEFRLAIHGEVVIGLDGDENEHMGVTPASIVHAKVADGLGSRSC